MARTNKVGIDYFSLDVHMDTKIKLVEAKFGLEGFAIVIKLYQHIYDQGYYCSWTEDDLLIFCLENNIGEELMSTLIEFMLTKNIFNMDKYQHYSILTSSGIQKRYIQATQRRQEINFIKEYLLVVITPETYRKNTNVNINRINVDINSKKEDINSQSKVKESKVNKSTTTTYIESNRSKDIGALITGLANELSNPSSSSKSNSFSKNDFQEIVKLYTEMIEMPNQHTADWIADMLQDYGVTWLKNAIIVANESGKRSMKYIKGILQNWKTGGGMILNKDDKRKLNREKLLESARRNDEERARKKIQQARGG
ncbi:MAG: Lin1244/Lin1753 domain-containing protein [Eubacteriaceae bacterium]